MDITSIHCGRKRITKEKKKKKKKPETQNERVLSLFVLCYQYSQQIDSVLM